ncbi:hypothetical protein [Paracoccus aerodenitrificans]|uniref:hypothetical protein n=1 Tax=Paracoccus aerodenitrificans TaxID=3017781 RepID=UPI0022EFFF31|nr:hypothetical protein [Paracoccus aerodenitrificans]WBU63187.1 hypothetical protein PAE61_12560 [Paracoccus aerodenitrificans]
MNKTKEEQMLLEESVESGFVQATGKQYRRFFARLHGQFQFDWYFEIGTNRGRSLQHSRSKSVSVDPQFIVDINVIGRKPQLHILQQTSDDFFDSDFLGKMGIRPTVSFLDGLHWFEFLLRDFMNTEDASSEVSIILMHDCCPFNNPMTTRNETDLKGRFWTGDVWKLIPILKEYRPDLQMTVLDLAPTGVVMLQGLKPGDRRLRDAYDEILARYEPMTLKEYGVDRFFSDFEFTDSAQIMNEGFPMFRPLAIDDAIKSKAVSA